MIMEATPYFSTQRAFCMWWELGEVQLGGVRERLWELEQFHKQFKRNSWQHSGVSVTLTYITY